jgi:hypothetical protein
MILSEAELSELTNKVRRDAQVKALRHMGLEHRIRPDGSVVVLKAHVERELGLRHDQNVIKETEPNWSNM